MVTAADAIKCGDCKHARSTTAYPMLSCDFRAEYVRPTWSCARFQPRTKANITHALIHRYGCGRRAFLADHLPLPDDPISHKGFFDLAGSPLRPFDPCQCHSCGRMLSQRDLHPSLFVPVSEAP